MAHAPASDRPRQETTGPFMTIDQGSNQLHYMKPPYKAHVQLSLDRGARSGMDASARRQTVDGRVRGCAREGASKVLAT